MKNEVPSLRDLPAPPPGREGWPWTTASTSLRPRRDDGSAWPRISIVTPSFNQGPYLEATIRSVLLQQYPNLEYIVIDGGSTDESVSILQKYAPWLSYSVSEPDRGQAHAINKGLERVTGEVFNWINSDDFLTAGSLGVIAQAFVDCDMVAGGNVLLSNSGPTGIRRARGLTARGLLRREPGSEVNQMAMWIRTEGAVACGGVDEEMHFAFDPDFFIRYLNSFPRVRYVDAILGFYRKHESAKTVAQRPNFMPERLRTIEKIRRDPTFASLLGDAAYAERKYEWWRSLAGIVNEPHRAGRMRALRIVWRSSMEPDLRWDHVTRNAVKNLLKGRELRPFTPVI